MHLVFLGLFLLGNWRALLVELSLCFALLMGITCSADDGFIVV